MKDHFNGRTEARGPPRVVTAEEQELRGLQYQEWLANGNREGSDGDPSKVHGEAFCMICHTGRYFSIHSPFDFSAP